MRFKHISEHLHPRHQRKLYTYHGHKLCAIKGIPLVYRHVNREQYIGCRYVYHAAYLSLCQVHLGAFQRLTYSYRRAETGQHQRHKQYQCRKRGPLPRLE